jgi:hypothetical protein
MKPEGKLFLQTREPKIVFSALRLGRELRLASRRKRLIASTRQTDARKKQRRR